MLRTTHTLPMLLASLASLASAACGGSAGSPSSTNPPLVHADDTRDPPVAADLSTAVDANNAFAISLYDQAAPSAAGGNFLTSPLSATLALTMTYAGAQGTTRSQMASALHIPSVGPSIFDAQNALSQALDGRAAAALASDQASAKDNMQPAPSASDYVVDVVNSVWGQTGYPWAAPFLGVLAKDYGTGVFVEDFETAPAPAETAINQWVSSETAGKINPLLGQGAITRDTRLVLVNAIHLKLPWAYPFQSDQTQTGTFTRGDGTKVHTDFMNQTYEFDAGYVETSAGQFVSLPLSGNLSVVFALPKKDLASLTVSLTKDSFAVQGSAAVALSLPKFNFASSSFSLADALKALGMTDAFDAVKADFKGMCPTTPDGENLFIADVVQKATLDVAENGVEAAAATAVLVEAGSVAVDPVVVNVNHPFIVSIVDSSGAILFLGQIDDPTDSGS